MYVCMVIVRDTAHYLPVMHPKHLLYCSHVFSIQLNQKRLLW